MRRHLVALVAATATVVSLGAVGLVSGPSAQAAPKPAPQTTAAAKPTVPTEANCATAKPGHARCFSLKRTDIKATKGVRPSVDPDGYGPADLQDAYALPSAAGSGVVVAIVDAFDNPSAEEDLAVYRSQYGLPPCTTANGCFRKVNQRGEQGSYPPPDAGWAGEIALDVDMVSAVCPQCHILLVEGDDNSLENLGESVDLAVSMGAKYVSNSYGLGFEDPDTTALNAYYDHPGVAVTVSTGDDGTGPSWPATTNTVTAVGGTSLTSASGDRGWSESAWAGAGSGCSVQEEKPAWQDDPDCANRVEADVSAVADPATGVAVYNAYSDDGWTVYGGTSASAPIIAGVYALAGTPVAGTYPGSYPYAARGALFDVTTGDNGSCAIDYVCQAGPGYDGPTGLGTPNGVAAFRSGPHGTLKGKVTKAGGGALAGAVVSAGDAAATTDATGAYSLSLPTGTYTVTASAYGYRTASVSGVKVTDGGTVNRSFALAAVPSRAVGGVVTDGSGHGWPLYAKITFDGVPGGPVYTDPFTGRWDTTLPQGGTYTGHIESVVPGYASKDISVTVRNVDVTKNQKLVADTTSCAAPGYTTAYRGTHETFDGTTKPAGWTVVDNNGSGGTWTFTDDGGRGNLTGGEGGFAIIDSDHLGQDHTQDTSLVSPVTDLSSIAAPVLELNSYYRSFSNSTAAIDVKVGSGAWTTVWSQTTTTVGGPLSIALPMAANKKAVQVRFHYTGTWAYYWEVDDVLLGSKACTPVSGGLVAGFTKDANTKLGVNGVTVTTAGATPATGVSMATPDDGAIGDGFYWLFTSGGSHQLTASSGAYKTATATTVVRSNYVTRQDFSLRAGRLDVSPAGVTGTTVLGGSTSKDVVLKNTGTAPVHVEIGEQDGGFVIAGKPAAKAYAGMPGAAVNRVKGTFGTGRVAGSVARKAAAPTRSARPAEAPWQAIADYPTPISNNAMAAGDGVVYSVSGYDGTDDVTSAYAYDPATLAWTPIADLSITREMPSAAFIGGKLVVTGGWGPDGSPTGVTEVYDPASDTWTTKAENPSPYAAAGTAVVDGLLYVVGGCDTTSCGTTDVMVYDPVADTWTAGPDYPVSNAWMSCGGIGAVYCAGGTTDATTTAKGWSLDPSVGAWTPIADAPADVWGAGYSVANGQLIVSGGVVDGSSAVTNEGWAFDPASGAWSDLPASNNAFYRGGAACGFYKAGGSTGNTDPVHVEAEVLPGYDTCGAGAADVSWLSASPTTLDLAPGKSATVTVGLDSSTVTQPGTYTAKLVLGTDTPYAAGPVAVTMVVTPPRTWGKVAGVVSGAACTGTTAPISGATLQIDTWAASYTLSTAADGTYAIWMDTRSNPLTLIAAKDGWAPQTTTARLTAGGTVTKSFTLKPAKACT